MFAKLTSKNQLTLPKEARDGVLILTPARFQRADAVRSKLAELGLEQADLDEAVDWARRKVAGAPAEYASDDAAPARPKARKMGKHKP